MRYNVLVEDRGPMNATARLGDKGTYLLVSSYLSRIDKWFYYASIVISESILAWFFPSYLLDSVDLSSYLLVPLQSILMSTVPFYTSSYVTCTLSGLGERSLSNLQLSNSAMNMHNDNNGHNGGIGGLDPRDRSQQQQQQQQQQRHVNPMLTAAKAGDPPVLGSIYITLSYIPPHLHTRVHICYPLIYPINPWFLL